MERLRRLAQEALPESSGVDGRLEHLFARVSVPLLFGFSGDASPILLADE